MLQALHIQDFVLIDRLALDFAGGLNVLTGETGAGKSILLDALGLALGARADVGQIRHGAGQATITASFSLPARHPAEDWLQQEGLPSDEPLLLRRVLTADGKSRAFVNAQPVTVAQLRALGALLVEIQGQFEAHGLLDRTTHLDLLDQFGDLLAARHGVGNCWQEWQEAAARQATARAAITEARAAEEFLRTELAALAELAPQPGEEEQLAEARQLLLQKDKVEQALRTCQQELSGDQGAESRLARAQKSLLRAPQLPAAGDMLLQQLDRAAAELAEAAQQLDRLLGRLDGDGRNLDSIEERLFALRAAARKHQTSVAALPALHQQFQHQLEQLQLGDAALHQLEQEVAAAAASYDRAAATLRQQREQAAARMTQAVMSELPALHLERARFTVVVEPADPGPNGTERGQFLLAANPDSPAGPLHKVASGGELARCLLAIRLALTAGNAPLSLLFDEIDSGVGGATAAAIGERLARLGAHSQVLVVTHSPQVAAAGNRHWRVQKKLAAGRTTTHVELLTEAERIEEIARMLAGDKVTDAARAAAQALLVPAPPTARQRRAR